MITRKQAEEMSCQEAALCRDKEWEDTETRDILIDKTLLYLARIGKLDMQVDDDGTFSFSLGNDKA